MKYIKLFEDNNYESLIGLKRGDIVVCIKDQGVNSFTLENDQKYIIDRILLPVTHDENEHKLKDVNEISDFNNIENYYFTLKKMNSERVLSSDNTNSLIFSSIRFLPEFAYTASKYNI